MIIKKICPVCKQEFETNNGHKEKTTCSRSCSNTHFSDRRHTVASRAKRSTAGIKRPWQRRRYEISKPCPICGDLIVNIPSLVKKWKTCKKRTCISQNRSNSLVGRTGGPRPGGGWGKQTEYAGVMWDSTWEARLAKRLDDLHIRWIRPNKQLSIPYVTLEGKFRNYYPDIFLPDSGVFLEVKGYWTPESRHKVKQGQLNHRVIVLESLDAIDAFIGA